MALENHIDDDMRHGDVVASRSDGGDAEHVVILMRCRTTDPVDARSATQMGCFGDPVGRGPELFGRARLARRCPGRPRQDEPHRGSRHVPLLRCYVGARTGARFRNHESRPDRDIHARNRHEQVGWSHGATGFLGVTSSGLFAAPDWRVRVLARQTKIDHPQFAGLQLDAVPGDLSNGGRPCARWWDGADVYSCMPVSSKGQCGGFRRP